MTENLSSAQAMKFMAAVVCSVILAGGLTSAQPMLPPPDQLLSPNQLNDLVAPIALYPDPLLSQLLVASTYPLEVVQAYQWTQRNPGLQGPALAEAAAQQNWDASVQALVMFPDVLKRLNDDVTWTTTLGNAFLAQQQDVMDAIQRMRALAQQAGKLASSPQENVVAGFQNGQPVIEILPVNPNIIYVPVYDPAWIWGPAVWYPYPRWWWPPRTVIYGGLGFGFGTGINLGFFFGAGWHGWGGWGWQPGWGAHNVVVNDSFIHEYNFNGGRRGDHGTTTWTHDSTHRQGIPYARPELNRQYRGFEQNRPLQPRAPQAAPPQQHVTIPIPGERPPVREAQRPEPQPSPPQVRVGVPGQGERLGNRQIPQNAPPAQNRSVFGGQDNGRAAQTQSERGFSSIGPARSAPARMPTAPTAKPAAPQSRPSAPESRPAPPPRRGRGG